MRKTLAGMAAMFIAGVALIGMAAQGAPTVEIGAGERLPVVAIADYCQTNGVVSARRNMAEAILKAGCLPVTRAAAPTRNASSLWRRREGCRSSASATAAR